MHIVVRLAVVAALGVVYAPLLLRLARIWWVDSYSAHGMFVPMFSALLLWTARGRLQRAAGRGHPAGILLVVAAVALLVLGRAAGLVAVQALSIVVALTGLALWSFGPAFVRAAAFPLAFLVFMVPLPRAFVGAITLHLQRFAAMTAVELTDVLEIPALRVDDVFIALPGMTLEVAEICNGLRFLAALVVLTVAFAYVTQRTIPRQVVLSLSAIPIAILANAMRVAVIVAAVHYVGPQAASGPLHHAIGKGVWVLTFIPLIALGLLLRRGAPPQRSEPASPDPRVAPPDREVREEVAGVTETRPRRLV